MKLPIIMPNYNKGDYLKEALESVFNQSLKNIVLYFYDDGSTDDSLDIVKDFKQFHKLSHDQIRIYSRTINKGVAYTLNQAVKQVKKDNFDYFYIMASDDTIDPMLLQKLVDLIDEDHDFYTCHAKMYGIEDRIFKSEQNLTIDSFKDRSPLLTTGIYSVKMWTELGGRKEDWMITHDYEFFIRMFLAGYKHKVLDEVLYFWRNYPGQLSRRKADPRWTMQKALEINGIK